MIETWAVSVGFVVALGSVVVRRPVSGLVWNAVHGGVHRWRADGPVRRAHYLATSAAALGLGAWLVVLQQLDLGGGPDRVDPARVVIGVVLTVLAALLVFRAFRLSTKRLLRDDR